MSGDLRKWRRLLIIYMLLMNRGVPWVVTSQ